MLHKVSLYGGADGEVGSSICMGMDAWLGRAWHVCGVSNGIIRPMHHSVWLLQTPVLEQALVCLFLVGAARAILSNAALVQVHHAMASKHHVHMQYALMHVLMLLRAL
jgi:hypothetical protein